MALVNYPPEALVIPYQLVFIWIMIAVVVAIAASYSQSRLRGYSENTTEKSSESPGGLGGRFGNGLKIAFLPYIEEQIGKRIKVEEKLKFMSSSD